MAQDKSSQSQRKEQPVRDHQQIADDNQQSGVVDTEEIRSRASEREHAEGSDEMESQEDEGA